jgi:hypothetical protein
MGSTKIPITGGRDLRRNLKELGDEAVNDLKRINEEGVEIVLEEALARVPVRSGDLKATVRGSATKTRGTIRAGFKKIPYAGPIHFGWADRRIKPNMFLYEAVDARRDEVADAYQEQIKKLKRKHKL